MNVVCRLMSLFSVVAVTISCGSSSPNSQLNAEVTQAMALRAYEIVDAIDYLPFEFKDDGCYARAFVMSMELAAAGIPSSAQFVSGDLHPSPKIAWRYHVAPMLLIRDSNEHAIIDPSMLVAPAPLKSWVSSMKPIGEVKLSAVPGSFYRPNYPAEPNEQHVVRSFDEMPSFDLTHIDSACTTLYSYLGNENAANVEQKRKKLLNQIQQLTNSLQHMGKVSKDGTILPLNQVSSVSCSDWGTLTL